eukprot:TRINITY_DN2344_c0_g1_i1.p1 TRINITY_DN2344_c0_g1~~TRINITY_DN2344_c0_g1_i1.p1  ORF type:complete len:301 (-),score=32.41 TRINITY_DN2344_c0_g1_i1:168-1070(-)
MSGSEGRTICPAVNKQEQNNMNSMLGPSSCLSLDFQGGGKTSFIECENVRKRPVSGIEGAMSDHEAEMGDEDGMEDGLKKRRLSFEQVKTLEKNFELGNKLEPERKMQLAKALGLQPRQIAVWFQNRRARWKTKKLEKDFETLKREYEALKCRYNALVDEKIRFKAEVERLTKELEGKGAASENRAAESSVDHVKEAKDKCMKCTEPIQQAQEGGCSSIISEASSVFNFDSPRTIDSPPSPAHFLEKEQTPKLNYETSLYCAKMKEEDQSCLPIDKESCSNLFYCLDQEAFLWEYWTHDS